MCHRVSLIVHSSMFAVWGNRTHDAKLFSARNLDWNEDTGEDTNVSPATFISTSTVRSFSRLGINKFKLVMVTVPNDGA